MSDNQSPRMQSPIAFSVLFTVLLVVTCCLFFGSAYGQSSTATLSGEVVDQNGAVVPGAAVMIVNPTTGFTREATTNDSGVYNFPSLAPGSYSVTVRRDDFAPIEIKNVVLNVGDQKALQIQLKAGDINATVQVINDAPLTNNESAAVSTVVDRQFAENLPMNARSFQTLIQLTPGVVVVPSNPSDSGQFSVNGQRAASNYWTLDGVSANVGVGATNAGNGFGGAVGTFSVLGGTNSLVSVDAMQEFRIQTSTYAPEFGRTPGAQISIVTRSGSNQFHGTLFDYLRNDVLDANNWFANSVSLPKPKERQNDFGGTFSGPITKNRSFFFFSYEGLRLSLPQTTLSTVPDPTARQNAVAAMRPFLNAYPLPNGSDNVATGIAQFNASYSDPATLDAYSIRIDHRLRDKLTLFGRYNYSPSSLGQRGSGTFSLSTIDRRSITAQTATVGITWSLSSAAVNDLRFNYSRTNASESSHQDTFGGAIPLEILPFPATFSSQNASLTLVIFSLKQFSLSVGRLGHNEQLQFNIVDNLSLQEGSHSLKFGVDFRRLSPLFDPSLYSQQAIFGSVMSANNGSALFASTASNARATFLFRNLGIYAQDTWRVLPRLTLTYGLRWDVDFVPKALNGPSLPAVTGFNTADLSQLALAPAGMSPYRTTYGNVAPRIGVAYQISQRQNWQTIVRGGFGVFYDLATSEMGNQIFTGRYPFGGSAFLFGPTFPLTPAQAAPPPIAPPNASNLGSLLAIDPQLKLPYTLEWNVAFEQALGKQQAISVSYIGAAGRRLLQTGTVAAPNPNVFNAKIVTNTGTSDYDALQIQFQRRLSHHVQALASYSWAHSIDTGSAGSTLVSSNQFLLSTSSATNRGPSDFDIRHAFSAGLTYEIPAPKSTGFANAMLSGWSTDSFITVRSAPPVNVSDSKFFQFNGGLFGDVRPDVVAGQPFYLHGSQYPGGKALNPAAFTDPPVDPITRNPVRQGNLSRNALRGFGAFQWDLAVHRDFPIHESLKLQFRAEMFNVLNHPNFGPPNGSFGFGGFGVSSQMLNQSLNGGVAGNNSGGGAFSPLYQIGGPRSIQFGLKLSF
jgi:carboxypeptidase family protein/TonB-dependent receptor-like protein